MWVNGIRAKWEILWYRYQQLHFLAIGCTCVYIRYSFQWFWNLLGGSTALLRLANSKTKQSRKLLINLADQSLHEILWWYVLSAVETSNTNIVCTVNIQWLTHSWHGVSIWYTYIITAACQNQPGHHTSLRRKWQVVRLESRTQSNNCNVDIFQ